MSLCAVVEFALTISLTSVPSTRWTAWELRRQGRQAKGDEEGKYNRSTSSCRVGSSTTLIGLSGLIGNKANMKKEQHWVCQCWRSW